MFSETLCEQSVIWARSENKLGKRLCQFFLFSLHLHLIFLSLHLSSLACSFTKAFFKNKTLKSEHFPFHFYQDRFGKKKKNLTTPCFLYLATTGNSLQLKALHTCFSARLLFHCRADRRNGGQTNPWAWNQSFTMTAKNTAKARACAVQTSTGTTRQGWALKICSPSLQEISKRLFGDCSSVWCFHKITDSNFSREQRDSKAS